MKEQELARHLESGRLHPVYLVFGEESFLVDRAARKIMDAVVEPATRDFNLSIMYGSDCKGTEITDTANTLPMFASRRLVLVRQAEKLPAQTQELLLSYLLDPAPETCLVFQAGKPDMRRKLFSELKKLPGAIEYKKLYDDKLAPFVTAEAGIHGKKIDGAAAAMLAFMVGNNLQELVSQIEKAAVYTGGRSVITAEDVKDIVSQSKHFTAFELARFMAEKNLQRSLITLQSMLQNGEEAPMILGAIANHFRRLWRIRELLDKKMSPAEIGSQLKINSFFLNDLVAQAKKHTVPDLGIFFEMMYSGDVAVKTGGSSATVLQGLVFYICG